MQQFNSQICPQLLEVNRNFLSWMIAEESSFEGGIIKIMVHQMGLLNESQISNQILTNDTEFKV